MGVNQVCLPFISFRFGIYICIYVPKIYKHMASLESGKKEKRLENVAGSSRDLKTSPNLKAHHHQEWKMAGCCFLLELYNIHILL